MKRLRIMILLVWILVLAGCMSSYRQATQQEIQNSFLLKQSMTKEDVKKIMGIPVKAEFSGDFTAWHYCRTGYGADEFLFVIFKSDQLIKTGNYMVTIFDSGGITGDCSKFARSIDFVSLQPSGQGEKNEPLRELENSHYYPNYDVYFGYSYQDYDYNVSGYNINNFESVHGEVNVDQGGGDGYIYDEFGNEIYLDVEWTGYGTLEGYDLEGNYYELEVDN